ncbi:MAG TPA: hypothetical protein VFB07_09575, partial [Vicinamibacterales bacterium]|nr:hypothetical protein [Vicinamibacterales bacterium]
MDWDRWNEWAGGVGAFGVAVVGVILGVWFHFHPYQAASTTAAISEQHGLASESVMSAVVQWLPIGLIVLGVVMGGALHFLAARTDQRRKLRVAEQSPYPTVQVFRHRETKQATYDAVFSHFASAGWRVEGMTTDLPQDATGIRVRGGSSFNREMA